MKSGFDQLERELVHAERDLAAASQSPRRRPARRVRVVVGVAASCLVAGAATYGAVALTTDSVRESPWARMVLRRVAAVVVPASSNTILYVAGSETLSPDAQRGSATHVASLTAREWSQQGPPWRSLMILQDAGGPVLREAGDGRVYDTQNHVVYAPPSLPSGHPKYTITRGARPDRYMIRFETKHGLITQSIARSEVRALRDGTDTTFWAETFNGHQAKLLPLIGPSARGVAKLSSQQPSGSSSQFAAELRGLLRSGHARVIRATTDDGRPAIEISSVHPQSGPQTHYYVNPKTYTPIEVDTYGFDNPADVIRIHFTTYEQLPLKGNEHLLNLNAPRNAAINRNATDTFRHMGLPPFW